MKVQDTYVRARVNQTLKTESVRVFNRLGLTTAEAIRIFLTQVTLRRALPFPLELPDETENDDLLLPGKMRQSALDAFYDD
jgi:DNA-damage-inducible protein J